MNLELNLNLAKLLIVENNKPIDTENYPPAPFKKEVLEDLPLSPNNPPWHSGIAVASWVASLIFILFVPLIGITIYIAANYEKFSDPKTLADKVQSDPNAILANIISIIPAHLLTIGLAWFVVTNVNKYSFREMLGWKWGKFNGLQTFGYMAVIVVGFFALAYLLTNIFGDSENQLTEILKSSNTAVYTIAFMATFTAPLVEEVIYRGILYSAFQRTFGVGLAVVIVTLLFAGVHIPQYWGSTATIIMICLLSLVLTLIRVKTDNLLPCIVLHTVLNGIQSFGLVANTFVKETPPVTTEQAVSFIQLLK
jgi:uncharacterized protein